MCLSTTEILLLHSFEVVRPTIFQFYSVRLTQLLFDLSYQFSYFVLNIYLNKLTISAKIVIIPENRYEFEINITHACLEN